MTLKSLYNVIILISIGMIWPTDMIEAQVSEPFSEPGDQYERIYPARGLDITTSAVYPNGRGHVMLGLEIRQDTTQERLLVTFLDFKGTISNSIEITYGDSIDVDILEAGDVIRLSDGTYAFSAILDKDSLNKAVTRIDGQGNIAWTELTGQETDTKDLRRSNSILLEIPGEKIWHAHIVDGLGSTTQLQITEFEFDGTQNFVRTLNISSDGRAALDEDLFEMALAIDSTIMLLGSTDDPEIPFFLSNLDTLGTVNWTRGYNGDFGRVLGDDGYDFIQRVDTTWVVTGSVLGNGVQRNEGFVMQVDNDGERLRTMRFAANSTQFQLYPTGVVELLDSTVTISMTREDMITQRLNPLLANYDLDSIFNYQTLLDTVVSVEPRFSELVTTDSMSASYLTTSAFLTDRLPYITKVDPSGATQCEEPSEILVVDTVNFQEMTLDLVITDQDIFVDSIESVRSPYGRLQPPVLTINDTTFCPQDPVVYVVDATVRGGTEYIWEDDSTDPIRLITETGMFMVTVTIEEELCFKLCDTISVMQLDPPMVSIGKSSTGFCVTGDIILTANQTGSAAESLVWSTGETTVSITVPGIEGDSYSVTTVDGCELTAEASTTITIADLIPPVEGEIIFSCGNPGLLTAQGTGFGSLLWSTGDTTRLLNITEPDTYTLTLFDVCGEPAIVDEITISAQDLDDCTSCDNPCLTWPNALHPANAEPENQVFGPVIRAGCENLIEDYELQIFNRWGKSIFTSTDVNVTWNGAINGNNQPGGVYYYWSRYSDGTTTCERRGDMTLLR